MFLWAGMLSLWVGQGHEKKGKDQPLLGLLLPSASSAIFPQTLMFHASSTGNLRQGVPAGTRSLGQGVPAGPAAVAGQGRSGAGCAAEPSGVSTQWEMRCPRDVPGDPCGAAPNHGQGPALALRPPRGELRAPAAAGARAHRKTLGNKRCFVKELRR